MAGEAPAASGRRSSFNHFTTVFGRSTSPGDDGACFDGIVSDNKFWLDRTHSLASSRSLASSNSSLRLRRTDSKRLLLNVAPLERSSPVWLQLEGIQRRWRAKRAASKEARCIKIVQVEIIIATVVVLQGCALGVEGELSTATGKPTGVAGRILFVVEVIFTLIFSFELLFHVSALRHRFFCQLSGAFEAFLVLVSWVDLCLEVVGSSVTAKTLESLRLLRLFRLARLARVIQSFPEVRNLISGLACTVMACIWAIALLLLIAYVGALICTVLLANSNDEDVQVLFGSVGDSMLTHIKLALAEAWPDIAAPLVLQSGMWACYVILFVCIVNIGLLSVVTGVVCEKVLVIAAAAPPDSKEVLDGRQESMRQKWDRIFESANENGDADLDSHEMLRLLRVPEARCMLQELGIDLPVKKHQLFIVLNAARERGYHFHSWYYAIMRLRGARKDKVTGGVQRDVILRKTKHVAVIRGVERQICCAARQTLAELGARLGELIQRQAESFGNLHEPIGATLALQTQVSKVDPVLLAPDCEDSLPEGCAAEGAVSPELVQLEVLQQDEPRSQSKSSAQGDGQWSETHCSCAELTASLQGLLQSLDDVAPSSPPTLGTLPAAEGNEGLRFLPRSNVVDRSIGGGLSSDDFSDLRPCIDGGSFSVAVRPIRPGEGGGCVSEGGGRPRNPTDPWKIPVITPQSDCVAGVIDVGLSSSRSFWGLWRHLEEDVQDVCGPRLWSPLSSNRVRLMAQQFLQDSPPSRHASAPATLVSERTSPSGSSSPLASVPLSPSTRVVDSESCTSEQGSRREASSSECSEAEACLWS